MDLDQDYTAILSRNFKFVVLLNIILSISISSIEVSYNFESSESLHPYNRV